MSLDKHFKLTKEKDAIYWYDGGLGETVTLPNYINGLKFKNKKRCI